MIKHQISKGRQLGNASNRINTFMKWSIALMSVNSWVKIYFKSSQVFWPPEWSEICATKVCNHFPCRVAVGMVRGIQNHPIAKFLTTFALLDYQVSIRSKCEDTASYGQHLGGPCARDKENGVFLDKTSLRGTSSDKCISKLLKRFIKTIRDSSQDHLMSSGGLFTTQRSSTTYHWI